MKTPIIIKLEGWISFLIPFLSFVGGSSVLTGPIGQYIALVCLALVGGLSGLKSFLSTSYADSLPDATPDKETIFRHADGSTAEVITLPPNQTKTTT